MAYRYRPSREPDEAPIGPSSLPPYPIASALPVEAAGVVGGTASGEQGAVALIVIGERVALSFWNSIDFCKKIVTIRLE